MNKLLLTFFGFVASLIISMTTQFWLFMLIGICTTVILAAYIGRLLDNDEKTLQNVGRTKMSPRDKMKDPEKKIRDAVEKEWNNQSVFDDAEKMK